MSRNAYGQRASNYASKETSAHACHGSWGTGIVKQFQDESRVFAVGRQRAAERSQSFERVLGYADVALANRLQIVPRMRCSCLQDFFVGVGGILFGGCVHFCSITCIHAD